MGRRFTIRLAGSVKFQTLAHGIGFLQTGSLGNFESALLTLLRILETAGFRVSHGERIQNERLFAAGQGICFFGENDRFRSIANGWVFIRGEVARQQEQNLTIVGMKLQ